MDDKGLSSPISGPRVSSTDLEFAPDSLLEGTGIRTIGPAEGARRPRGVGSRSRRTSVGAESGRGDLSRF